jgi:hypothetical protein
MAAGAQREGRGRLSSIDLVPEHAQDDIVWACAELNKRERSQEDIRFELNNRLEVKGVEPISRSAFNRKALRLSMAARRLDEARHIFAGLADQFTPEKVDENNIVLGEFIKLLVFELAQDDAAKQSPKGAMELSKAYLAAVQAQRLSADRRQRLDAEARSLAARAIDKVGAARGLSTEAKEEFKRELFGVRDAG